MPPKTIKQQLLEARYPPDADLEADIRGLRALGWSWREIANTISARAGVDVSYELLRSWYRQRVADVIFTEETVQNDHEGTP